ncbi:4a-hydroxytetrahydrobiopterin dehydratase [Actinoplanes lutulentus]|uniref:Putative pterin-4-alpha-carbinolamine dehydratase n=1 Tax=Actinoplanes lutulentus TaxID=1287878 RepID=A0A327Z389_9ACTN|nr:VOC family protein [Actinoplanes lutulentus]MBB2943894.1 4a-hydroxytetrahydrobiopterin dehydratase [Actinoplanes lutulentus]RAK29433.1 4a-hydroxytetrahydrobiopterin dehydratase [Actinoplanes lutulentus]
MTKLTAREIVERAPDGWVYLLGALHTRLRTGDFATGLALVNAIGAAAEAADHHPDLDLRYTYVDVTLVSHDIGAVSGRDLRFARTVADLCEEAGVALEREGIAKLEFALDSPESGKIVPFWAAVLRGEIGTDEVKNPDLPTLWFQQSGNDEPRQRWHPDLWVDPSEVQERIDAAIKAGGRLVSDAEAPSFWVLEDPDGNKVCLCTWQDRT